MDPGNILFDDLADLPRVRSHFGLRRQSVTGADHRPSTALSDDR